MGLYWELWQFLFRELEAKRQNPIQTSLFLQILKPYISAPASRRMMPLVPNESTTQDLSFEPPLTSAEGR